jgi:hypothetical protein
MLPVGDADPLGRQMLTKGMEQAKGVTHVSRHFASHILGP